MKSFSSVSVSRMFLRNLPRRVWVREKDSSTELIPTIFLVVCCTPRESQKNWKGHMYVCCILERKTNQLQRTKGCGHFFFDHVTGQLEHAIVFVQFLSGEYDKLVSCHSLEAADRFWGCSSLLCTCGQRSIFWHILSWSKLSWNFLELSQKMMACIPK